MNSTEFVQDFTNWIKNHTSLEGLYISENNDKADFYALTSNKRIFLQNFMIFSDYDRTCYCKLYNFNEMPYLEIEFESGNSAIIEFISKDHIIQEGMKKLF